MRKSFEKCLIFVSKYMMSSEKYVKINGEEKRKRITNCEIAAVEARKVRLDNFC